MWGPEVRLGGESSVVRMADVRWFGPDAYTYTLHAGWPALSMKREKVSFDGSVLWDLQTLVDPKPLRVRLVMMLRPSPQFEGALPNRPLTLGFAINTFLCAAVLLGMVEGVAFARRRARRWEGRCPACGYDRAGLAEGVVCPECGGKA